MTTPPNVKLDAEARGGKLLRGLLIFFLLLLLTMFAALAGLSLWLRFTTQNVFWFQNSTAVNVIGLTLVVVALVTLVAWGLVCWRRWVSWRGLSIGWFLALLLLLWLVRDEATVRWPLTAGQFSPGFTGENESNDVLLQYSNSHPSAEAKAFIADEFRHQGSGNK